MEIHSHVHEEVMSMTINTDPSIMETFLHDWIADANDKLRGTTAPVSPGSDATADGLQLESVLDPVEGSQDSGDSSEESTSEPEVLAPDATVLVEGPQGQSEGCSSPGGQGWSEEPVLSLVSMNPKTTSSFDLVRGSLTVLPELPASSSAVRTVRVNCGRDPLNTVVVSDSRVSQVHFSLKLRAARGGLVTLELLDQSTNGTWVNGKRVGRNASTPLAIGDHIVALPASLVGRAAEVGFLLLHDSHGARCGGGQESQQSLPPSPRDVSVPSDIENAIRCGICTDTLLHCLTLVPCGHNFCTACLVKWRRRSYTCPECREPVQQAVRSTSIDRLVETFLLAHPEAARTEAELKAMEVAERDPNNTAMLRWLTRPGPSWVGGQTDTRNAANTATPVRRAQAGARTVQRQDASSSSACVVS